MHSKRKNLFFLACNHCFKLFESNHKNRIYCSEKCAAQARKDRKPEKKVIAKPPKVHIATKALVVKIQHLAVLQCAYCENGRYIPTPTLDRCPSCRDSLKNKIK